VNGSGEMTGTETRIGGRRGLGLALIAAAQFVVIMDTSIIGVAFAVQSGTTAYPAVPH
jgi:hypothetical protein